MKQHWDRARGRCYANDDGSATALRATIETQPRTSAVIGARKSPRKGLLLGGRSSLNFRTARQLCGLTRDKRMIIFTPVAGEPHEKNWPLRGDDSRTRRRQLSVVCMARRHNGDEGTAPSNSGDDGGCM